MRQLTGEALSAGVYPPNDMGITGGWIVLRWERRLKPNTSEIVSEARTIHVSAPRASQAIDNLNRHAEFV